MDIVRILTENKSKVAGLDFSHGVIIEGELRKKRSNRVVKWRRKYGLGCTHLACAQRYMLSYTHCLSFQVLRAVQDLRGHVLLDGLAHTRGWRD